MEVEDRPLEALDERVEVGAARRDAVVADARRAARVAERATELGPLSVVAVTSRSPARRQAGSTSSRRKRAMTAAVLSPATTRAMPNEEAPSTALSCQTLPTTFSWPT